jgi:hypothetical protein
MQVYRVARFKVWKKKNWSWLKEVTTISCNHQFPNLMDTKIIGQRWWKFVTWKIVQRWMLAIGWEELGRSSNGKSCDPLDKRCYDASTVSYKFLCSPNFLLLCIQVVYPIHFFYLTITSFYFLQTNYYTQIYQFNLLLT